MEVKRACSSLYIRPSTVENDCPRGGVGCRWGLSFEMTDVWGTQGVKGDFGKWQHVARSPLHLSASGMAKGRCVAGL